jgi:putative transcriptional regulator
VSDDRVPTGAAHHRLLVSVPAMGDENFEQSVVLVLEHDADGALGVVLNQPTGEAVAPHLPELAELVASPPVFFLGGPVSVGGLITVGRRRLDAPGEHLRPVVGPVVLVDPDPLLDGEPVGVDLLRVYTGYSGWSAGQLDAELAAGAWHVVDPMPDDVFCVEPATLWRSVMRRQGGRLAAQGLYPDDVSVN